MKLDPKNALYVLHALVAKGRVRASQVRAILTDRKREIARLRARLQELEQTARAEARSAARTVRRRTRKLSPKVRALRRLQGRYMGYVRRLKPAAKARVRAVREKKGLDAAIRLAASIVRR